MQLLCNVALRQHHIPSIGSAGQLLTCCFSLATSRCSHAALRMFSHLLLLTFAGALALANAAINTTAYFSYLRAWLHTIDNRDFNSVAQLGVLRETLVHFLRWVLFHSVFVQLLGENSDRSPMRDGMPLIIEISFACPVHTSVGSLWTCQSPHQVHKLSYRVQSASGSTWRRRADRDRSPSRAFGQLARKLNEKEMLSWGSASAYEVGVLPTQHISKQCPWDRGASLSCTFGVWHPVVLSLPSLVCARCLGRSLKLLSFARCLRELLKLGASVAPAAAVCGDCALDGEVAAELPSGASKYMKYG